MDTFQAGEKVRFIDGRLFSNGEEVATIEKTLHIAGVEKVMLLETNSWTYSNNLEKEVAQ